MRQKKNKTKTHIKSLNDFIVQRMEHIEAKKPLTIDTKKGSPNHQKWSEYKTNERKNKISNKMNNGMWYNNLDPVIIIICCVLVANGKWQNMVQFMRCDSFWCRFIHDILIYELLLFIFLFFSLQVGGILPFSQFLEIIFLFFFYDYLPITRIKHPTEKSKMQIASIHILWHNMKCENCEMLTTKIMRLLLLWWWWPRFLPYSDDDRMLNVFCFTIIFTN